MINNTAIRSQWDYNVIKATPHKACAEDAPTDFFVRLYRNSAGILSYVKGFLCKMTENMSADSVQSRQAGFARCCLKVPCKIGSIVFAGLTIDVKSDHYFVG